MGYIKNLDFLSVGITVAAIGILGFIVFLNNRKSATNRAFLLLSVITIFYGIFNYVNYQIYSPEIAFWFLRLTIFFAVWHVFSLFNLFFIFPQEKVVLPKLYKFAIMPLAAGVSFLTLTPLVFESISELSGGRIVRIDNGPAILLFGATLCFFILVSFFILFKKTYKAKGQERTQFLFILIGTIATFSLLIVFNFIFPAILDNSRYVPLGALFMFPFIACTFYAILKHGFLRVRVIAAEILTFGLAVITLFEIIVSDTTLALIFRSGIFSMVLIFGILLIKSVLREVEQREKLEVLTKELEKANEKLKELDHLKSEFLSFASHQIKAPLAAIKGFATLIYDGTYGEVSDKVKEAAHKIASSVDRMVQLVTDFLNVRKIEEGKVEYKFEKADVIKIIKETADELRLLAQNKKLEFSYESTTGEAWTNVDIQRIRQVFQNLIENAIKYTDIGFVKVKVEVKEGSLVFSVSDSGHGISKELLPHLFEEFRRDGKEKQIEGTGLGLFIAKSIVESHHGKIWVESEGPGHGSTFFVEIPFA